MAIFGIGVTEGYFSLESVSLPAIIKYYQNMSAKAAIKFLLSLTLIFSFQLNAQESFQRLFTTSDRNLVNIGVEPANDGGFFLLNFSLDRQNQGPDVNKLIVTKHDQKGTLLWSSEYTLKDQSFITNLKATDFTRIEDDTLVIVGSSVDFAAGFAQDERYFLKIEPNQGNVEFVDLISNTEDELLPLSYPVAVNGFNGEFNYFGSHSSVDSFGIQRVEYNDKDSVLSKRAYFKINADQSPPFSALTDAQTTVDSNYVLSYVSNGFSTTTGLMTLDKDGAILSADDYTLSPDSLSSFAMQTLAIEATPDTGIVQAGILINGLTGTVSNYLIKTDSTGAIQWSKLIDGNMNGFISQVNDVLYTSEDEIMVTGKYIDITTFSVGDFSIFFDTNGSLLRQWDYSTDNSFFIQINPDQTVLTFPNGEVDNMKDGGMVYSTIGFDPQDPSFSPYVIKTDPFGRAFCEDSLTLDLVRDYAFVRNATDAGSSDFAVVDTFETQRDIYNNFSVPVLTLLDTVFCPQDPIMVTLDATLETASTYEWSTGETTPTIEVFDEGEYSVTVTFEEKVCYTLCDTSNISRREFPEATIDAVFFGTCQLDSILLQLGSNNPIVDVAWSTGDTVNSAIIVQEAGLYSVVIVDDCGNAAEAQINISDGLIQGVPEILDIFASGRNCNGVSLTPTVVGQVEGLSYAWSTGETSQSILVDENGNYSLTVTNSCGNSDELSINILNLDMITVDILDSGACDSLELFADVPLGSFVGTLTYSWSDGSTSAVLDDIQGVGLYSVTVTDTCGTTATDEYAISDTIVFPDVFYPNNPVNDENRTFGPFIRCPDFFEGDNYMLQIYNRFGNRVFESNNLNNRWNGTYSGEVAPREVYFYQWSYDLPDGESVTGEGSVTLFR